MLVNIPLAIVLAFIIQAPRLATGLLPGMQLVYGSGGQDQAPWTVDSVRADLPVMTAGDCATIFMRRSSGQAQAPENRLCVRGDTLFAFDAARSEWSPQRPVGAGMTMIFRRTNGDTVRYITGTSGEETISGIRIPFVATTVLTVDSVGKPRRRLTERYAVTLATATGGRFEVPESAPAGGASGGWRTEQEFVLREIRGR